MEKKNVVIFVAGQRFSIATADTQEYVMEIGRKVDVMINGISKDNPRLNRDSCAILTALNFCDDETKLRQMMEVLREQVKEYINTNDALRTENIKLKEEIKALKADASKDEPVSAAPSIPAPSKSEAIIAAEAQTRHTAFVGKDFKSDKNNNNHNKQNPKKPAFNPPAEVTPSVINPSADADEVQAEAVSPYHQFSIFDDLP